MNNRTLIACFDAFALIACLDAFAVVIARKMQCLKMYVSAWTAKLYHQNSLDASFVVMEIRI